MKRKIAADYSSGNDILKPFYRFDISGTDYAEIIEQRKKYKIDRNVLADVLTQQYKDFEGTEEVKKNISLLRSDTTFTVTTGQQPSLFGGPMYNLYKTITAILLCKKLKADFPNLNFVPVFWIAGEDHDYEEVNNTWLDFDTKITYPGDITGAVGRHIINESIGNLKGASGWIGQFYKPGETWGIAFFRFLHTLFSEYGLVVLDADNTALKKLFVPIIKEEVLNGGSFPLLLSQSEKLEKAGYPIQLTPREINMFYLKDSIRSRIIKLKDNTWGLNEAEGQWTAAEIEREIIEHPERFSPNAALRPVYQETILPNLVYIGGWGEIAYWMELLPAFDLYKTFYPLILPRCSALLVTEKQQTEMEALQLSLLDLLLPEVALREKMVMRHWAKNNLEDSFFDIDIQLGLMSQYVAQIDEGQSRNILGEQAKFRKFYGRLLKKLVNRLSQKHPNWANPALELKKQIQPDGSVQERFLNWMAFAQDNPKKLISKLMESLNPLEPKTRTVIVPG